LKTRSLAFRYSLFFLAGTLFIFTVAFLYVSNYSMQLMLEEAKKDAGDISDLVISRVDRSLSQLEMIPQLEKLSWEGSHATLEEMEQVLTRVIRDDPYAFGTCIAFEPGSYRKGHTFYAPYIYETRDGIRVKDLGETGYNYLDKPWYRIPKATGKAGWSEPYFDEGGGDTLMCTYSVPFYHTVKGKRVFQGVITVDISLNALSSIVSSVRIYKTGFGFLVSAEGRIITFPRREYIGKDLTSLIDTGHRAQAKMILSHMKAGHRGFVRLNPREGETPNWFYYAPVASTGWSFGVIFPRNELFSALVSLLYGLLFIFAASVLAVLVMTILVTRKFTRPIKQLVTATRRIGQGDFSTPIPVYRSGDEIAQLGNSFSLMKEELMNYIQNLKETTSAKEKIESELKVAHSIQMGLLPKEFPLRPELDLFATLVSARAVGGDLYDFFFLDHDHLFLAIGDVSGKGVPGSLFMTLTRTLFRTLISEGVPLAKVVERVNLELCHENPNSIFVTFLPCLLQISSGKLTVCNAGHNPPLVVRSGKQAAWWEIHPNGPLGAMEETTFTEDHLVLEPGDQLILYTDGITEATDPGLELFGEKRLAALVDSFSARGTRAVVNGIVNGVNAFAAGSEQADDITLLMLAFLGPAGALKEHPPRTLDLENNVSELPKIPAILEELAREWSLPGKVQNDLDLALEELFTNIVYYAFDEPGPRLIRTRFERIPGGISVTVEDEGRHFNLVDSEQSRTDTPADEREIGGLGIRLVKELMDAVEYTRTGGKNRITITRYYQ
jgi:phosphoserine phosphatase RsbU/P